MYVRVWKDMHAQRTILVRRGGREGEGTGMKDGNQKALRVSLEKKSLIGSVPIFYKKNTFMYFVVKYELFKK